MFERACIRRLRNGIVPSREIDHLSVGYDRLREEVLENLSRLDANETVPPMFVLGEWGAGKSHLLTFIRAACRELGVANSVVGLNARSHALNHPQRFYPLIVRNLEIGEHGRGLQQILLDWLRDTNSRDEIQIFTWSSEIDGFTRPLQSLCDRAEQTGHLSVVDDAAWTILLGEDLSWADYAYKRNKALTRISELVRLLKVKGAAGLVLMFDEMETIDQLWNIRSRMGAYSVFGKLCQMRGVWCIVAITARLERTIREDYERGILTRDGLTENAKWFLTSWKEGGLNVVVPPVLNSEAATQLGRKIYEVYTRAYETKPGDVSRLERCIDDWNKNPGRNPRVLIKSVVHELDCLRPLRT